MAASAGSVGFNEQILQSQRPNLFELLAQEAMHEALRPAFQYICKVSVCMTKGEREREREREGERKRKRAQLTKGGRRGK